VGDDQEAKEGEHEHAGGLCAPRAVASFRSINESLARGSKDRMCFASECSSERTIRTKGKRNAVIYAHDELSISLSYNRNANQ
jgi:hypothetical protein